MGTGSGTWWVEGEIPTFKKATNVCSLLNITGCLKSVSLRGKMIPEELEKQIWQARKQVRGEKEKEGKEMYACIGV